MAITKIEQLDSVELAPGDRFRVRMSTFFVVDGVEQASGEPRYFMLNPATTGHSAAINSCRSAFNAVQRAVKADR